MEPGERTDCGKSGPWAVQDGLRMLLVRFFFRLAVWHRFFGPLGLLLGRLGALLASYWAVLGSLGLVLGHYGGHFGAFNFSLLSSLGPSALCSSALCNAGRRTARCAIRMSAILHNCNFKRFAHFNLPIAIPTTHSRHFYSFT